MATESSANRSRRAREVGLALSVGVVLADSSIVTLALPDVLRDFDGTVVGVSWVLTAFNLALAAAILPAAMLSRRRPGATWAVGMAVFVLASAACAAANTEAALIAARVAQALGGALTVAGAIECLARLRGNHAAAAPIWGTAGTIGVAVGPALGGLLTELFSWQSIFLVQLPLLLIVPLAFGVALPAPERGREGPRDLRPEAALAFLSGGLTGALFLLVILLTEGWGLSPVAAAATVSAMPIAAYAVRWIEHRAGPPPAAALAGGIAVAGGLIALAILPGANWALTLQPQLLIGAGLALALPVLTLAAVGGRDPRGERASATIAARHAGIVVGILALAPILSAQLNSQTLAAQDSTTALLLDAPLPPESKVALASELGDLAEAADGRLPDVRPAFDAVGDDADAGAVAELEADVIDQIERASTNAFSLPFLTAAAFALIAVVPIYSIGRRP